MAKANVALVVRIYEPSVGEDYPVVEHRFFGRTRREAEGYYRAHLKADRFLRGCVEEGHFADFECDSEIYWEKP